MSVSQPPPLLWMYLKSLEDICASFSDPLTLTHETKLKRLHHLKTSHATTEIWSSFSNSLFRNAPISTNSIVMEVLNILTWISEYVLRSICDQVEKSVSFSIMQFRQIQTLALSLTPFDATSNLFREECSDEDIRTSLSHFNILLCKPLQFEAIRSTLQNMNVLCLFPTGYGKSLIYQLPATLEYGISIVFSPLCSLLSDQLKELQNRGISSAWLKSNISQEEEEKIYMELNSSVVRLRILLLTPEKYVQSSKVQNVMSELQRRHLIRRFVFDEVHCLSLWGRSFRPRYLELSVVRKMYPDVPVLALTATANAETIMDIVEESRRLTIESGYYERSVPPFLAQGKGKGASSTLMPQARLYVESPFLTASHAGHRKPPKMKSCSISVISQLLHGFASKTPLSRYLLPSRSD